MADKKQFRPHKILREIYRHYPEFEDLFRHHGVHVIDHVVPIKKDDVVVKRIPITISFFDLKDGLRPQKSGGIISDRKLQAVMLNVVADMTQKEAGAVMGITEVSVGQYVDYAMEQLARKYFPELYDDNEILLDVESVDSLESYMKGSNN